MIQSFLQNLKKEIPHFEKKKYLLAVSGGVDSMAMVELFRQAKLKFSVAHCNFQLRKEDSLLDEILVTETLKDLEFSLYLKRFETESIAQNSKESIQITARKIRYEWFNNLTNQYNYDFIVTGHHADDNLETIIYKLAKGTGIKGVRGILPIHQNIFRPLLNFTKNNLIDFAKENDIIWREDVSNSTLKYKRNFIRHQIIPLLTELNPKIADNIPQTTARLRLAEQALNEKINYLKKQIIIKKDTNTYSISKSSIKEHNITTPLFFELIADFKFTYSTCKLIINNIDNHSGKTYESNTDFILYNDRNAFILSIPLKETSTIKIPIKEGSYTIGNSTLFISIIPYQRSYQFEKDKNTSYFNADLLKGYFEVRNWSLGDKISPFGMTGQQKISDILINNKVTKKKKKKELVLAYKDQIIWLIGRRASNLYKISQSSILRLHVKENI